MRTDKQGNLRWSTRIGTAGLDNGQGVAPGPAGSLLVIGLTYGTLGPAAQGEEDIYIASFPDQ
ncbi:MAG: hypothetical protein ACI8QC_000945 [Planctomycetota bacterium]|jgi:hypothetical protein